MLDALAADDDGRRRGPGRRRALLGARVEVDPLAERGRAERRSGAARRWPSSAPPAGSATTSPRPRTSTGELPYDAGRAERLNPRLRNARQLVAAGAVTIDGPLAVVRAEDHVQHVQLAADGSADLRLPVVVGLRRQPRPLQARARSPAHDQRLQTTAVPTTPQILGTTGTDHAVTAARCTDPGPADRVAALVRALVDAGTESDAARVRDLLRDVDEPTRRALRPGLKTAIAEVRAQGRMWSGLGTYDALGVANPRLHGPVPPRRSALQSYWRWGPTAGLPFVDVLLDRRTRPGYRTC